MSVLWCSGMWQRTVRLLCRRRCTVRLTYSAQNKAETTGCSKTFIPICLTTRTLHPTILGIILYFNVLPLPSRLFPVGFLGWSFVHLCRHPLHTAWLILFLAFVYPCIVSTIVNDYQQDATILVYLFILKQLYMFRAMSSPIIRSTWLYLQHLILSTVIAAGWCHEWDGTDLRSGPASSNTGGQYQML